MTAGVRHLMRRSVPGSRLSRRRRAAGCLALIALATPYALYAHFTDDEYIRRQAVRVLSEMTGGEVRIASARFSLFVGVTLNGVRVSTPYDAGFAASAQDRGSREIFSASEVELQHAPWSLALGRLQVRRIVASTPAFTLIYDAETNRYNYDLLFRHRVPQTEPAGAPLWPEITLRSAQVTLVRRENGRTTTVPPYALDADAWPCAGSAAAYEFDCRVYGDMPHRVRGVFDPARQRVSETPFVAYASIRQVLPRSYSAFFDQFGLVGRFRAKELEFGALAAASRRIRVEFREVSFSLPMPLGGTTNPPSPPFVRGGEGRYAPLVLTGLSGAVELAGQQLTLSLEGRLNGAVCRARGTLSGLDRPLEQIGIDVTVDCDRLAFPEGEVRGRLLADATVPHRLHEFLIDYDPHGTIDLRAQIVRDVGPRHTLRFRGRMVALDASARYRGFDYRLEHLTGEVRFEPDGISLDGLVGRHATALVRVDGRIASADWWTGVDLDIRGAAVPLGADLYAALSERYRGLWRRLNPRGWGRAHVHIVRGGGSPERGSEPWRTSVDLDLEDAAICFDRFAYPLEGVRGRMHMETERIDFENLTGRSGDASVRVDGWADIRDAARPEVELRVEASSVGLDATLWDVLPAATRAGLTSLGLTGRADVLGRVSLHDPAQGVTYDLRARLHGVGLRMEAFPYPLSEVSGWARITPEAWTLTELAGKHGGAEMRGDGVIRRDAEGVSVGMTVRCTGLPLDAALREALPPRLREAWTVFEPSGRVDATTVVLARGRAGAVTTRYRTELTMKDGRLRYAGFPLELEHVGGRLLLSERRAEIVDLQGRIAESRATASASAPASAPAAIVRISGTLDLSGEAVCGGLRVSADGLALEDARLRAALPGVLREYFDATHPRGRASIALDSLSLSRGAGGSPTWEAQGRMVLDGVDLAAGVELRAARGTLTGRMRADARGVTALDAVMRLDSVRMQSWPMRQVAARLAVSQGERTLHVESITGEAFGGRVSGFAELRFGAKKPRYGVSLTLADAELAEFLTAARGSAAGGRAVRGRMWGTLSVAGVPGEAASREGGGELLLHEAQVWKLPLVLAILRVLDLKPDENAFEEARVRYFVMGSVLRLSRVELYGKALALAGAGSYDTRTDALDLKLAAGTPGPMRVPLLTELMEGAAREMMEVRVRGTLAEPSINAQPLRAVRQFLDELLSQPRAEGG